MTNNSAKPYSKNKIKLNKATFMDLLFKNKKMKILI